MANKRITEVDFIDLLNSDESFFINRNNSIKQISRENLKIMPTTGGKFTGDVTMGSNLILSNGINVETELSNISNSINNINY